MLKRRISRPCCRDYVAHHGKGLEKDLRPGHGRPQIQHHASFEFLDAPRIDEKIGIARPPHRRAVAIGMSVENVATDSHVAGNRNAPAPTRRGQAQIGVWGSLLDESAPERFAQPFAPLGGLAHPFVDPAGLAPQTELAGADPAGHVFARPPEGRQLEVVDHSRAVGGHVGHDPPLDQIDQETRQPQLDRVRPRKRITGRWERRAARHSFDQRFQFGMLVGSRGRPERPALLPAEVVAALGQLGQLDAAPIEQLVAAHGVRLVFPSSAECAASESGFSPRSTGMQQRALSQIIRSYDGLFISSR